jgi:pimeloyl-ACP methyl ester carboxylesterase
VRVAGNDVKELTRVAGHAAADVTRGIEQVHGAIARRAWAPAPDVARPVQVAHDLIAGGIYGGVRLGLNLGAAAGGTVLGVVGRAAGWRPLGDTRGGATALALLNSVAGDRLEQAGSDIALPMRVRVDGADVALTPAGVRSAFPAATGDVAVFLHGLGETDLSWRWGAKPSYGEEPATYGSRLADDLGVTPVFVRYNTGLRIADNGRLLDTLLDELTAAWPVPVERLTLVGHSMGGLVMRSACHVGERRRARWVDPVAHCVYLGSPHLGAPLARSVQGLRRALDALPETRPLATALRGLSAGIADLGHGVVVDDDVLLGAPDQTVEAAEAARDAWLARRRGDVPLLAGCRHHAVSATLAPRSAFILDHLVGDLLVQTTSATGRGGRRRLEFVAEEGFNLRGAHHFSLLNHPRVYGQLCTWLAGGEQAEPAA